jgi:probable O-glycosylation ligase (exosortase A-associated)
MALAGATLAGAVRFLPAFAQWFRNPAVAMLLMLQVPTALSVIFCTGRFLAEDRYSEYLRMILIVMLIPVFCDTAARVKNLILVMAFSLGALGIKFGLYGIVQGGVQFTDGIGEQYDNNTLGLAMAMAAPLCWFARSLVSSAWAKMALLFMVVTAAATVIMTNSRGASLSLAAAFLFVAFRSKHKILTLIVLVAATAPTIYLVKDQYFKRMKTLDSYRDEASAASRIEFAGAAIRMWQAYPILGVGFGSRNYAALNEEFLGREDVHGTHNTYLQVLADSGCFAYLLYTGLLFGIVVWLGQMSHIQGDAGNIRQMAVALRASLIAFMVGGTFGSMQRYDFTYMLIMTTAALWRVCEETGIEEGNPEKTDTMATDRDSGMVVYS